jgi:putative spermidine/putrescine transport system ATP-binding protein
VRSPDRVADLRLVGLSKNYGDVAAVRDVSLDITPGEFVALLGPSGCGKTTTLRMVAGFVQPSTGQILLGDVDVTRLPPERRDMGMVFQSYALFPHMTVQANIEFGLKCHRLVRAERTQRIDEVLDLVGLAAMADRYPRQLSGGQQQRVALARVMALRPRLLLFDEPLSNLDAKLRLQMRDEIRRLQRQSGVTALFVTHDQEEAMTMADRIVVMSKGHVEQVGTPADVYDRPRTRFVADFIGAANFFEGTVEGAGSGRGFRCRSGLVLPLPAEAPAASILAVRPERIAFVSPDRDRSIVGTVSRVRQIASVMEYLVTLHSGDVVTVQVQRRQAAPQFVEGEAAAITLSTADPILLQC